MRIEDLATEGSNGINDLCQLSEKLGYKSNQYFTYGKSNLLSLVNFLEDNPGAISAIYHWVDTEYSDQLDSDLESEVESLFTDSEYEYEIREDYSGRGMFGSKSEFAITTDAEPDSGLGQELIALGLTYDNMGKGWVYYLK
jgi:hypothetical protein